MLALKRLRRYGDIAAISKQQHNFRSRGDTNETTTGILIHDGE